MVQVQFSDDTYHFQMNGYDIEFFHKVKESSHADLWNLTYISRNGKTVLPRGTDVVGVLRERKEKNFMGGVHGNETNVFFSVSGDGAPVQNGGVYDSVHLTMDSHLFRVSTNEHIIDRHVEIDLFDGHIVIDNTFTCLIDSFALWHAYNGGLFAVYEKDIRSASTNLGPIETAGLAIERYLEPKGVTEASFTLPTGSVTLRNLIGKEAPTYNGISYYYGNEAIPRVKIYFGTDHYSLWEKGHICRGKAEYILA